MRYTTFYIFTIVAVAILTSCGSYKYQIKEYQGPSLKGWIVTHNDQIYLGFTKDEFGAFPEDKQRAEGRFDRRKEFLEKYYNIRGRGELTIQELMKASVGIWFIPLFIVDEYRVHVFGGEHTAEKLSDKEINKREKEQELYFKILREFIAQDMDYERSLVIKETHNNSFE